MTMRELLDVLKAATKEERLELADLVFSLPIRSNFEAVGLSALTWAEFQSVTGIDFNPIDIGLVSELPHIVVAKTPETYGQ